MNVKDHQILCISAQGYLEHIVTHVKQGSLSIAGFFYRDMMKIKISENPTFPMKSINNKKMEED